MELDARGAERNALGTVPRDQGQWLVLWDSAWCSGTLPSAVGIESGALGAEPSALGTKPGAQGAVPGALGQRPVLWGYRSQGLKR